MTYAPTIYLTLRNGQAAAVPATFLGEGVFAEYRNATYKAGARFDKTAKAQLAPLEATGRVREALEKAGFAVVIQPDLEGAIKALAEQAVVEVAGASARATKVDVELKARGLALYPFQKAGVEWLAPRKAALLCDSMGLGKTVQALIAAPEGAPILVIAPAVAKGVWRRETKRWRTDLSVAVLQGRGSFRWPQKGELVTTNYDILPEEIPPGCLPGTVLIADEVHMAKSGKALRTKRFRAIRRVVTKAGGRAWGLTGTPLLNRPQELWSILYALGLETLIFDSWTTFIALFNGTEGEWGGLEWGTPDPSVGSRLKRGMLRRLRRDVLPDLPDRTIQEVSAELDAKSMIVCDAMMAKLQAEGILDLPPEQMLAALLSSDVAFEMLSAMRQALAVAKIPALLELVEQFEEQDEPLVVFSAHRAPIDILGKREGWAAITGDTPPAKRTEIEDAFQSGSLRGVAATTQAGGVAITLTRAAHAILVDRTWTPALDEQAMDRLCRIGQKRAVVITDLVADHELDERIHDLQCRKTEMIGASVERANLLANEIPEGRASQLLALLKTSGRKKS